MLGLVVPLWARVALAAAALAAVAAALLGYRASLVESGRAEMRAAYAVAAAAQDKEARKKTEILQRNADHLTEVHNAKDNDNRARIAALSASLRNRPDRASQAAPLACPAQRCTGTGLYRDDAEFLIWYASEAAKISAALDRCQSQYVKAIEVQK